MRFVLVALAFIIGSSSASAAPVAPPITEFHQVTDNIYRGALQGSAGLEALSKMGIKTDLNLNNDEAQNDEEEAAAAAVGIRYIARPMSGFFAPRDSEVDEILSILADKSNYPIYVHCLHGQDRTGLIVGLFRVFNQNWAPTAAYDEMLQYNFHTSLFLLNSYFKNRTGYQQGFEADDVALDRLYP